ncbi:MAG: BatA domain-containing protein [Planctomycetaceae bacterium]|jgi:hypothetical protein|nr:BatA domain-containing protein [Planctomycetaceae bacterium]
MTFETLTLLALEFGSPSMLFGLGAASIPIIIHLLHKRRYKKTSWAAMKFLMEAARQQSRRLRWEQLIVLLVRCLAVMLLAMAFSRPFFENAFSSVSGRAPRHIIVVLDDSFSMGHLIGNETRLEQGKEAVRQLLQTSVSGDGYSLLCLSDERQSNLLAPTFRQDSFLAELEKIGLTEQPIDLHGALARLESLLIDSPQPREKELLIVSDFQQKDWSPTGTKKQLLESRLARLASENVHFTFLNVGGGDIGNVAITDLNVEPQPVLIGQPSSITVTLQSFAGQPLENLAVELLIDDRSVASQSINEPRKQSTDITFLHNWQSAGPKKIVVKMVGDRLEADNQRFQVVVVRDAISVLLVEGQPAGSPREQSSHYLRTALETVMHPTTSAPLFDITVTDLPGMTELPLQNYEVLALCNLPGISSHQSAMVRRHLSSGGGLLLIQGDQTDAQSWNAQLNLFNDQAWPLTLNRSDPSTESVWGFLTSELNHPVVKLFAGNPGTGLDAAVIWQRVAWTVDDADRIETILSFDDGTPAIVEVDLPVGRCLQMALSCDATSGSWAPLNGSFPPIAIEMIRYLAVHNGDNSKYLVGQTLEGLLPADQFIPEITVTDPAGKSISLEPTAMSSENPLRGWLFDENSKSGFYQIGFGQPSLPTQYIAVNVDAQEGNLTAADPKQLEKELFKNPQLNLRIAPTVSEITKFQESPLSLELLWLGLAFLAVEVALVWNFSTGLVAMLAVVIVAGVLHLAPWIGPAPAIAGGVLIVCLLFLMILQRFLTRHPKKTSRSLF